MRPPVVESLSKFAFGLVILLVLVWATGISPAQFGPAVAVYGWPALRTVGLTTLYALPLIVLLGVPAGLKAGSTLDRVLQAPALILAGVPALLTLAAFGWIGLPGQRELAAAIVVAPWLGRAVRNGLAGTVAAGGWSNLRAVLGRMLQESGNLVVVTAPLHAPPVLSSAVPGANLSSQTLGLAVPVLMGHLLGSLLTGNLSRRETGRRKASRFWMEAGALLLLILMASVLSSFGQPEQFDPGARMVPPGSGEHLLGTDNLGRDMLSRLSAGARSSLVMAVGATAVASVIGVLLAGVGRLAGRVGAAILSPRVQAPNLFWIYVAGLILLPLGQPSVPWFIGAIGLASVPLIAYPLRCLLEGASGPPAMGLVGAMAFVMAQALFGDYLLSWAGLGLPPPAVSLGGLVASMAPLFDSAAHLMLPGGLLALGIGGFLLFGEALSEDSGDM
ncbi:MAG TPA: hypothetical protein VD969_07510 [Symbiobacteriaceae bacterium]|nr:hypothetical protein [Symbiobacteriaceae bacterium]